MIEIAGVADRAAVGVDGALGVGRAAGAVHDGQHIRRDNTGLRRGEHIRVPAQNNHPAQFLISLMQAVGVNINTLGDISGNIPELYS